MTDTLQQTAEQAVKSLVLKGDISAMNPTERAQYYLDLCDKLGLNPATCPFSFLTLNGKDILYPTRSATDQLAAIHRLTREIIDGPKVIDLQGTKLVYAVCRVTDPNGRTETAIATVPCSDPLHAMMKVETKSKRRATLSILGLGALDKSEGDLIKPEGSRSNGAKPAPTSAPLAENPKSAVNDLIECLATQKDITLLDGARTWRQYAQAIYQETGSDINKIYDVQMKVIGSLAVNATINQLNNHVEALKLRDELPNDKVLADVMDLLALTDHTEDLLEVWRSHRTGIASSGQSTQALLRSLATRRAQELMPELTDARRAAQWFKKMLSTNGSPEQEAIEAEANGAITKNTT